MSITIFNGTRSITDVRATNPDAAATFDLSANYSNLVLGRSAFVTSEILWAPAIKLGNWSSATISGEVYAMSDAIVGGGTNGYTSVKLTADGIVGSSDGRAIELVGSGSSVVNEGYLSGWFQTVHFAGDTGNPRTIVNSGTIIGHSEAILIEGGSFTLTNSGLICSTYADGFVMEANDSGYSSFVRLENTGIIRSYGSGVSIAGTARVTIQNSGEISGFTAIETGSGNDQVVNVGHLTGDVVLGGGDDVFDTSQGFVVGRVDGGYGDDKLIGSVLDDILDGSYGRDRLIGGAGDDVLTGGGDADRLEGGAGLDTASYLSAWNVTVDLVYPTLNTGDAAGDMFSSIENLVGSYGDDLLYGSKIANVLTGGEGNDLLDGRGGADTLIGGNGADVYVVDMVRDVVIEQADGGYDEVRSSVSYRLGDNVEALTLTGAKAIAGTGNAAANTIKGNEAANLLDGGAGADVLTGAGGADTFRLSELSTDGTPADTITDFEVGVDRLRLAQDVFALDGKVLKPALFWTGTEAHDADDRVIYDSATGNLFFDADGNGGGEQFLIAHLQPGLLLTPADITIGG